MSKIGYARISSKGQNIDRQIKILNEKGAERIFEDKLSGKNTKRPELQKMLNFIREGDVVMVLSLDRLSRNYTDIKNIINKIRGKGSNLLSFDLLPKNTGNKLMDNFIQDLLISMLSFVSENERIKIRERQKQGIALAKRRGVYKGRPKKYTSGNQSLKNAIKMYFERDKNNMTTDQIARLNGVSRSSIYRYKDLINFH